MTKRKLLQTKTHTREISFDVRQANTETREIPAALSSETGVQRYFGTEILVHEAGAVDLSRATGGLPLLWQHNQDQPIGLVRDVRLEDKRLRGTLHFSDNQRAAEIFRDVENGFLRNISIGYRIDKWEESADSDEIRVTGWTLMESSVVSVPADASVGINRAQPGDNPMPDDIKPEASGNPQQQADNRPAATPQPTPVVDLSSIRREQSIVADNARQQAIRDERQRVSDVSAVFDLPSVPRTADFAALRAKALDDGWTADQTRNIVLQAIPSGSAPAVDHSTNTDESRGLPNPEKPAGRGARIEQGEDSLDKFFRGAQDAFAVRAGLSTGREATTKARESGFLGVRLSRIAEEYLRMVGVDTRNLSDSEIAKRALTVEGRGVIRLPHGMVSRASGMTTSDFSNLLANTANKALLQGWDQAPETWASWTRIGQVPDFKQADRTGLSGFSSLELVPEDGDIKYGKFTDRKETIQAVSYAKKFRLTYQAIKNDDLNAFVSIPRGMGRAAQSIIGDTVYALLDGVGPTLNQDSTALWNTASHNNYVAAATAPNTSTLNTAFTAMAKQADPNSGKALNIVPRYLLVPKALETSGREQIMNTYDISASPGSTSGKNTMAANPFHNRLEVISDARLDGQTNGTAAWYLAADPNVFDTIEVAFVDGVAEPYLLEEQEWDTRGTEWVVGVDFGVSALDYRAMHKYKGNT